MVEIDSNGEEAALNDTSELDQYFIGCRELVIFCNLGFPGEVKSQM